MRKSEREVQGLRIQERQVQKDSQNAQARSIPYRCDTVLVLQECSPRKGRKWQIHGGV